jgi:hypothetical protein
MTFSASCADELARLESSLLSGQNRTLDIEQTYERDGRSWVISNDLFPLFTLRAKSAAL